MNISRPVLWDGSHKRLIGMISKGNPGLAMVVGLAAGLATCGWGSALMNALAESMFGMVSVASATGAATMVPAVTLSSLGVAMADAGLSAICSQAASSLMRTGSLKEMRQELTSSQFAKSLTITLTSAGLVNKLSGTLNLPSQPRGFEQHLKVNVVRSAVSAGLNMTIEGTKPKEALLDGLKSLAAHTVGQWMAGKIGDAFDLKKIDEIERLLSHGGGGALSGLMCALGDGDPLRGMLSGAIGAMTAELAVDLFSQEMTEQELIAKAQEEGRSLSQEDFTTLAKDIQRRADMAKVVGAFSAFALGQDVGIAALTASNAVEYNYAQHALYVLAAADVMLEIYSLTHPEEAEAYKQAAIQKVAEKTGLSPETIEQSFHGLMMAGATLGGGKGSLLKGLGTTLLKSEVGKKLQGMFKGKRDVSQIGVKSSSKSATQKQWITEPSSIQDQMALDYAKKGGGDPLKLKGTLGDSRYTGWIKYEVKVKSASGKNSVVHYVKNPKTGEMADFKFKKRTCDPVIIKPDL